MSETVEELKKCSPCNEEKSISEYYFRKETGKHKNVCKLCCIRGNKVQRNPTHKKCKHCDEWKPFSEYQKAGGGKWLQPYCKPCDRIRKAKHTEQNIEAIKIKKKQYYYSNRKLVSPEQKKVNRESVFIIQICNHYGGKIT